jgi:hypothetical protein
MSMQHIFASDSIDGIISSAIVLRERPGASFSLHRHYNPGFGGVNGDSGAFRRVYFLDLPINENDFEGITEKAIQYPSSEWLVVQNSSNAGSRLDPPNLKVVYSDGTSVAEAVWSYFHSRAESMLPAMASFSLNNRDSPCVLKAYGRHGVDFTNNARILRIALAGLRGYNSPVKGALIRELSMGRAPDSIDLLLKEYAASLPVFEGLRSSAARNSEQGTNVVHTRIARASGYLKLIAEDLTERHKVPVAVIGMDIGEAEFSVYVHSANSAINLQKAVSDASAAMGKNGDVNPRAVRLKAGQIPAFADILDAEIAKQAKQ